MASDDRALARMRYLWATGTGAWATSRQLWASRPGQAFPAVTVTPAGRSLTVAYRGFPEGLTYVLPYLAEQQTALAGQVSTETGPTQPWRRLGRGLPTDGTPGGADLVLLGGSRRRVLALPSQHSVLLPFRVHQLLAIVGDAAAMHRSVSTNERRQFAKLRRLNRWETEVGRQEEDLEFFYERMHLPTMARRHGEEARSTDWAIARHELFHRGVLLFVDQGGKRVAGVLARLENDRTIMRMRLLGALDGDETHYRSGAVKAVYYLAMEWAADNGVTQIDLSNADPYPGKGVFQFKRRFHPTVVHAENHYSGRRVHLRATRDTPLLRDLLVATPMLTVDRSDRFVGTHFFDDTRPARTDVRCDGLGVHDSRRIDLDEFLSGLPGGADPATATTAKG